MDEYIGKTLREVKELHPDVRVMGVGDEHYVGTLDYVPTRLNVHLSLEGLDYEEIKQELFGTTFVTRKIKNLDDGIVESAEFG